MASGVNGGPGESVRGHVVQGYKLGHELVPIRGQLMEENNVPDQVERHAPVTLVVVQLMESGVLGSTGAHARIPVEWEHREDCAHATILNRPMGDVSALGRESKHVAVIKDLVQLTVSGVHGRSGSPVQRPVVEAFRSECEDATIQLLHMADKTARENMNRQHSAINRPVQLTVNGVNGLIGLPVQELAVWDKKHDRELAPTRVPPMVGMTV